MVTMRTLAATAAAAASLTLGLAAATPASAAEASVTASCTDWHDGNTYGAYCSSGASHFRAHAICNNGLDVVGPWQPVGGGTWSYAFCTSVNSQLAGYRIDLG
ncbi:hypothetical protein [Kitasatospora sp. NPDC005856]|uniref:hypothetical protein n=1 Tax=Kitasatospora sp. NPDC005856 TaxID=3154566 RepID=UPI0033E19850